MSFNPTAREMCNTIASITCVNPALKWRKPPKDVIDQMFKRIPTGKTDLQIAPGKTIEIDIRSEGHLVFARQTKRADGTDILTIYSHLFYLSGTGRFVVAPTYMADGVSATVYNFEDGCDHVHARARDSNEPTTSSRQYLLGTQSPSG